MSPGFAQLYRLGGAILGSLTEGAAGHEGGCALASSGSFLADQTPNQHQMSKANKEEAMSKKLVVRLGIATAVVGSLVGVGAVTYVAAQPTNTTFYALPNK
jgi:hypothetical protein